MEEEYDELKKATARGATEAVFEKKKESYKENEKVGIYLTHMHQDVGEHYRLFQASEKSEKMLLFSFIEDDKVKSKLLQLIWESGIQRFLCFDDDRLYHDQTRGFTYE